MKILGICVVFLIGIIGLVYGFTRQNSTDAIVIVGLSVWVLVDGYQIIKNGYLNN